MLILYPAEHYIQIHLCDTIVAKSANSKKDRSNNKGIFYLNQTLCINNKNVVPQSNFVLLRYISENDLQAKLSLQENGSSYQLKKILIKILRMVMGYFNLLHKLSNDF